MLQDQLEQLARIRQPEARSQLIRALVAEYARSDDKEPTATERELFSMIVLHVFDQLDREARYELVVRLAKTDRITSKLADRMADEEFDLAEPVIECSPVISESALVDLVRKGSVQHRRTIAMRKDLPESLTDAVLAHGGGLTTRIVLANVGTQISTKGFLAILIQANTDLQILAALAKRALEDCDVLETLTIAWENECPLIPAVLASALADEDLERLAQNAEDVMDSGVFEIDGEQVTRHEVNMQLANGELSFDSLLLRLIDDKRMDAAVWMIARKLELSETVVLGTMKSESDIAVMRLMLQAGVKAATFKTFFKARCEWQKRSLNTLPDIMARFKSEIRLAQRVFIDTEFDLRAASGA